MSEWIRVEDRLPSTNNLGIAHVLVYDKWDGGLSFYWRYTDKALKPIGDDNTNG